MRVPAEKKAAAYNDRRWTAEAIETAHWQRRELLASESLRTRQEWRDRMLARMKAFKSQNKL